MKKKVCLLTIILILTGCKTNIIECNKKEIKNEIETNNSIIITQKNNKIINMEIISEVGIPEKYKNQKEVLYNMINEQYKQIEQEYNVKPEINETEKNINIKFDMNEKQIKKYYNSKSTITTQKEIIKEFTNQKYICKKNNTNVLFLFI